MKIRNIIFVILILAVLALTGTLIYHNTISNKSAFNKIENIKIKKADTLNFIHLTDKQIGKKMVFQLLANEMIANIESRDSTKIDCGTRLTPEQYEIISNAGEAECSMEGIANDTMNLLDLPLFIHIVSSSTVKTNINSDQVNESVAILNNKFNTAKIKFSIKGIETINSQLFVNFKEADQGLLLNEYKKNRHINVYIFNSVTSIYGQPLNGYTSFSIGSDYIMLTAEAIRNGSTFSHEMGHFFYLFHTHGKTNNGNTDELVNRSSCSCTGDDICDTPADPNLFGIINSDCIYRQNKTDPNGDIYKPDPRNMMSYAHLCRNYFTKGQYNKIRWAAYKFREYLFRRII